MIADSEDMMSFRKSLHNFRAHTANPPLPVYLFSVCYLGARRPLPKDLNARVGPQGNPEM